MLCISYWVLSRTSHPLTNAKTLLEQANRVYTCAEGLLQELEEQEKREKHEQQAQGLPEEEMQQVNTVKTCSKSRRISKQARPNADEGWQEDSRQDWQDEFEGQS